MNRKDFLKKLRLLTFGYAIIYIFGVWKLYSPERSVQWNLFSYYGVIEIVILSIGYFVFGFWVTRFEK